MKQGWEIKRLGDVCTSDLGKTLNQSKDTGDMHPYLCAINILWDKIDFTTVKQTRFESSEIDRYSVRKDDLLICEGGDIGRAAIWDKDETMLYQNALHRVRFYGSIIPRFCLLYLRFLKNTGVLDGRYGKGVTIKHLVKSSLLSIPIPVPPLAEQEKIVAELDCLSGIIEKKKQQLKELDNLAQSIFYEMFGDPVENDKGWSEMKLGDICVSKKEIKRASKQFASADIIHYIDIASIDNVENVITGTAEYIFSEAPSRAQQVVCSGDVLISLVRPNLKNIAMVHFDNDLLVASSGFCVVRANNLSDKRFIRQILLSDSFTSYLMDRVSGANYPAVREDDIRDCKLGVPPLSLQQEFASKIEAIEKQKELIAKSIRETETLFNSRMDYYFN